jgi:prepilin signal peptidase PulO-like enzyme (type II secretory pathway)
VNAVATSEIVYPTWGLFVLVALISLLALVTVFLYKKRMLQIRFCLFNAVLMLGFYGFFAYLIVVMKQQLDVSISVRIALSFPVICLILDYLAIRNIGADETLVRSLERLR